MLIEKVLNNNVVITRDERNQEMIVMGKGLAFKKKVGDPIFDSCIDKKFQLTNDGLSQQFQELAQAIPLEYLEISCEIIEYTKEALQVHFFRFVTHLRFFLTRVLDGAKSEDGEVSEELFQVIQKKYKDTFGCVEKIADFLTGAFDYQMSTDEKMYLTIHTARLVHENRCK
ncbi:PRD domain-containing protein [Enterococcus faecium]|nr:PRD domain-containing protein [Enterococcus faecium]